MVGSTPCLDIVMLLMGIGMMSARPHHGYGEGPSSRSQRSAMAMADMEHGYGGNLHRGGSGPSWEHGYGGDLHRGRSGPPWSWRTMSIAMRGTSIAQRSTMAMADMKHGYGGNLHRGRSGPPWPWRTWSMAMRGTSIAVAAVHHGRHEAWLWGKPPSRSQRFIISIIGMKHGLAFE